MGKWSYVLYWEDRVLRCRRREWFSWEDRWVTDPCPFGGGGETLWMTVSMVTFSFGLAIGCRGSRSYMCMWFTMRRSYLR